MVTHHLREAGDFGMLALVPVVTGNEREFARIPGLACENWLR